MVKKVFVLTFVLFISGAFSAFAGGTESMPWDSGLETILDALAGTTTKVVGGILIVGAGLTIAFTSGQAAPKLFWAIIGVGIALNAVSFITMLFGAGNGALV